MSAKKGAEDLRILMELRARKLEALAVRTDSPSAREYYLEGAAIFRELVRRGHAPESIEQGEAHP